VRSQGIEISDRSVSRILHDADLQPHRQQMYLTSHDDEFRAKRDVRSEVKGDVQVRVNEQEHEQEHGRRRASRIQRNLRRAAPSGATGSARA